MGLPRPKEEDSGRVEESGFKIMVVEPEAAVALRLHRLFPDKHVRIFRESELDRVLERFEGDVYDVLVITSAAFTAGQMAGAELLELISVKSPHTQVLFLAEPEDTAAMMEALKAGAYHCAKFPIGDDELQLLVKTAIEQQPQLEYLPQDAPEQALTAQPILGRSKPIQEVYRQIRQAAATDIPVLVLGETGTGKDLAAQAIHLKSSRSAGPYVPVHLGALPQELVASELFGHEKGAFTGAFERREGKFELAHNGTIFLDEISTIDERVQVSLLRVIEQKKFNRLGGRRTQSSNARIIAATNEALSDLVDTGKFREDLMYRLDVFRIVLPPLRDRHGDIALLANVFITRFKHTFRKAIDGMAPECAALLEEYPWPGNIRELKNVIQRAVLICPGGALLPEHLPAHIRPAGSAQPTVTFPVGTPLHEVEREVIIRTLALAKSRTDAAKLLGISRRALYNKLEKYGIQ